MLVAAVIFYLQIYGSNFQVEVDNCPRRDGAPE